MEAQYITHEFAGAPNQAGVANEIVAFFDAVLVNGFNSGTVTAMSRSGSTVTCTRAAHGFKKYQLVEISGATETDYNGKWRILTIPDANTFTFDIGTLTPSTPATGTISSKTPPLGWTKEFTGTNAAAYRAASGLRYYFQADDNALTQTFRWRAWKTMSAYNTGTDQFPTDTRIAYTNNRWVKPITLRGWAIVGDDRRFFLTAGASSRGYLKTQFFGEFNSYLPADPYAVIATLLSNTSDAGAIIPAGLGLYKPSSDEFAVPTTSSQYYYLYAARNYLGIKESIYVGATSFPHSGLWAPLYGTTSTGTSGQVGVSPITGGFTFYQVDIEEYTGTSNYVCPRGRMPGLVGSPSAVGDLGDFTFLENVPLYGQLLLLPNNYGAQAGSYYAAVALCDWDAVMPGA